MTIRSLSQSIFLAAVLLCRSEAQTAVDGNQVRLLAELHTAASYSISQADCGKLLSFSSASPVSIAIPSAIGVLPTGCWLDLQNSGSGAATVTPTGVTIDGLASVLLDPGQGLHMVFTGSAFLSVHSGGVVWVNNVTGTGNTPVFSAGGTSGITFFYTLSADVSSSTLTEAAPGIYVFAITQDSVGGHSFAWPPTVTNAPPIDSGANDTTYLLCQYDGTNCVALGNYAAGASVIPGITIPGLTSGSNTLSPPAVAGTNSTTNLAPNGTTVVPNACTGQFVQAIASDGTVVCGTPAGGSGDSPATQNHGLMFPIGSVGGSPLTTSSVSGTLTVPFGCTIAGYSLAFGSGDSGTVTVKFWKAATGTQIPVNANSISTNGVGIATGTAVQSTNTSDFTTTTVAPFDLMAMAVTSVSGSPESLTGVLLCNQ